MRCSDGNFYVVKFAIIRSTCGCWPTSTWRPGWRRERSYRCRRQRSWRLESGWCEHTPELNIQLASTTIPCQPGLQFGSRYVVSPLEGQVFDYLPVDMLERVRNLETFAGILAMDKWTGNANGRQATFWRRMRERKYTVAFIDQGYCFNAGEWTFPDYPMRGVYRAKRGVRSVRGWESFEPWLSRIEKMGEEVVWRAAGEIPPEWYGNEWDALEASGQVAAGAKSHRVRGVDYCVPNVLQKSISELRMRRSGFRIEPMAAS